MPMGLDSEFPAFESSIETGELGFVIEVSRKNFRFESLLIIDDESSAMRKPTYDIRRRIIFQNVH